MDQTDDVVPERLLPCEGNRDLVKHNGNARASVREEPQAKRQVHSFHAVSLWNILHEYLSRTDGDKPTVKHDERARAETAGQAMNLDAGFEGLGAGR